MELSHILSKFPLCRDKTNSPSWSRGMLLLQRGLMVAWDAPGKAFPKGRGRWCFPSAQPQRGHTWSAVQIWAAQYRRDMDRLERFQQSSMKTTDWSIFPMGKGWKNWDCLAWGRGGLGESYECLQVHRGRVQREWSQWCPVTQPEAVGTHWNTRDPFWISWHIFYYGSKSTGTGCPGRLWSLPLDNIQKPSGHGLRQFVPGESAWAVGMDYKTLGGPFHPQVFYDSAIYSP